MHFIEVHMVSNRVDFTQMNNDMINHYILSFFTDEERDSFLADYFHCIEQSWLHPTHDEEFYNRIGKTMCTVVSPREIIRTFIAHDITKLCDNLFDEPHVGLNPAKKYFDENPSEGDYDVKVFDSQGNDVTDQYSKLN